VADPRLGNFLAAHPDVDVRLSANNRLVDLQAEGIDLGLRFGRQGEVPEHAERLFGETIVPVAHPSLGLRALDHPSLLEQQILLEFDGPYRPWLQWRQWLASQGWEGVNPRASCASTSTTRPSRRPSPARALPWAACP
jgi:DNA-binding transcriptional LysR family regulator